MLSGELGAGKTTFTQGLGDGLGVRGDVTSPTFVISRVHPSLGSGPPLVHVDAYRLGGIDELDDLDLDTSLEDAVTVVEWGEGIAEGLAESRLEIRIIRALAHQDEHADLDPRRVLMTPIGPRWYEMEVPSTHRPPLAEKLNENLLLDFRRCPESELDDLDPYIPLQLSLMVAEHDGRVLLVHNMLAAGVGAAGRRHRRTTSRPGRPPCACSARRPGRPRRRRVLRRRDRAARPRALHRVRRDLPHPRCTELSDFDAPTRTSTSWPGGTSYATTRACRRSTSTSRGWCSRPTSRPEPRLKRWHTSAELVGAR